MNGQIMPGVYCVAPKPVSKEDFDRKMKYLKQRAVEAREKLGSKN